MEKIASVEEIFPITKVENGFALSGVGDITFGYKLTLPNVFSLSEKAYENIHNSLVSIFKNLPVGCVVTQYDKYYTKEYENDKAEIHSFTLKENEKFLAGRTMLLHDSYLYVSYPDKNLSSLTSSQNSAIRMANYFKSSVYSSFPKSFERCVSLREEISSSFESIDHIEVKLLNDEELINNINDHWTFNGHYSEDSHFPAIQNEDGLLKVGDRYVKIVSLINQGEIVQQTKVPDSNDVGMLSDVKSEKNIGLDLGLMYNIGFGLPFEHKVIRTFIIRDEKKTNIKFYFTKNQEKFLSIATSKAAKRIEAIDTFTDAVENRNYTIVDMSCCVILNSNLPSQLSSMTEATKRALNKLNDSEVYSESYLDGLALWVGSTPGYTKGNYRTFITVMEHSLCYFNFETNIKGSIEGHKFIDRLGNPVIIDLWENKYINNRNALVEGGTGSGKSFWVNNLVDQDLEGGNHVIILDVGHSYKDQCKFHDGIYKNSSNLDGFTFPIFLCDKKAGKYTPDDEKQLFLLSILITIWKGNKSIDNEETAIVKKLITEFYKDYSSDSTPTMNDFYHFVNNYNISEAKSAFFNKEAFLTTLEPFIAGGQYYKLLNTESNVNLTDEKFIVFDVETVSSDDFLFPIVGLIIMEMTMNKIRKLRGIRKRFIIDEGWKILQSSMSNFVEYLFRTFRKNEGSVMLATQNINDLESKVGPHMAQALIANSSTYVLMARTTDQNVDDMKKYLSLTDFEIKLLEDVKKQNEYREFYIKQGVDSKILRTELSPKTVATYSSKGDEKARINRYYEENNNLEYAINQYSEDNIKLSFLKEILEDNIINYETYKKLQKKIINL